jgi:hypothetical protein
MLKPAKPTMPSSVRPDVVIILILLFLPEVIRWDLLELLRLAAVAYLTGAALILFYFNLKNPKP